MRLTNRYILLIASFIILIMLVAAIKYDLHSGNKPVGSNNESESGRPISGILKSSDRKLTVAFIDVGQGDSSLIKTPSGKCILIDGGGSVDSDNGESVGENTVIPFLRKMAVTKLDMVVLTHPHTDHIQGLLPILRTMPIDKMIDSGVVCDNLDYTNYLDIIKKKKIKRYIKHKGDSIDLGDGMKAYILNPPEFEPNYISDDLNNDSMVIRFTYKDTAFIFMADTGAYAESRMLADNETIRSNVIKIGHHGSRFSTTNEFLNACDPEIAVISVGANNQFRHPSNNTINKLKKRNIKIYRTDRNGAIIMTTDGMGSIDVTPFIDRR